MDLPHPHQACVTLLPVLLSPTPVEIPGSQLSELTRSAHHFLSTPTSSASYLQPVRVDKEVTRLRDELLESFSDLSLGTPLYAIDESGVRSLVPVGPSSLAIVLIWEAESISSLGGAFSGRPSQPSTSEDSDDDDRGLAGWKFLTLERIDPTSASAKHWHADLESAVAEWARQRTSSNDNTSTSKGSSGPISIKTPKGPAKTREEMAEGEGTTPGAYGAAEDFWDGWDDDVTDEPKATSTNANGINGASWIQDEAYAEKSYWDSYETDAGRSVMGDERDDRHDRSFGDNDDAQELAMDDDAPDFDSSSRRGLEPTHSIPPPLATRSRRSSTIRAPEGVSALGLSTGAESLLTPASSSAEIPEVDGKRTTPTVHDGPLLSDTSPDVDALRFALAGVWRLFTQGGGGATDAHREQFLRVASMVTRS